MKCSPIRPIYNTRNTLNRNFKNINDIDTSKNHSESNFFPDGTYLFQETKYNRNNQIRTQESSKYDEKDKRLESEFYKCEYYDNGKRKKESSIKQDILNSTQITMELEYYPDGTIKKADREIQSLSFCNK